MRTFVLAFASLSLASCGLLAQTPTMSCKDQGSRNQPTFCEIREVTIPSIAALIVDGRSNGGISVKGANRSDILVRSMVVARDASEASQVIVHTNGGAMADGPAQKDWSVSYEIFVPTGTSLSLSTNNGGVSIAGVESTIEFHAVNGGISLKNVGGTIRGNTVNGGISISLAGDRWTGQGIDVSTQNGGVSLKVPERFSALLDLATVNGGMSVRLPQAQGRADRKMTLTLGAGGPLSRLRTQNGGVSVSAA
jgi:hypothetical protein